MTILDDGADADEVQILVAFAAPENANRIENSWPTSRALLVLLRGLAKLVVDLRFAWKKLRGQQDELREVWAQVRGIEFVARAQYAYLKLSGGGDDPAKAEFMNRAEALSLAISNSAAYPGTNGDLCQPNARAINKAIDTEISSLSQSISSLLRDQSLLHAYTTWSDGWNLDAAKQGDFLLLGDEAHTVHMLLADAFEAVAEATPGAAIAAVLDTLVESPPDAIRGDPNTGTVLDVALPGWGGLAKGGAAQAAGSAVPLVGPDGLLLRALLLYCKTQAADHPLTAPGGQESKRRDSSEARGRPRPERRRGLKRVRPSR